MQLQPEGLADQLALGAGDRRLVAPVHQVTPMQRRIEVFGQRIEQNVLLHPQPVVRAAFEPQIFGPRAARRDLRYKVGDVLLFSALVYPPQHLGDAKDHHHVRRCIQPGLPGFVLDTGDPFVDGMAPVTYPQL